MSSKTKKKRSKTKGRGLRGRLLAPSRVGWRYLRRGLAVAVAIMLVWIIALSVLPVPVTPYMLAERWRLGTSLEREWTPIEEISPALQRAVVAAEDANFCLHWGLDIDAIRDAIASGAQRGGSTISQQTVKNTFLWHGRSWFRKALEAALPQVVELFWSKRRILEVYLNIAEFDTGVFGAEAAAQHYFGVDADALSARQAALLAAILPNPQNRSASQPSNAVAQRAASISDGAAALVLSSEREGARARILGHASHAQAPGWFTTAPVPAAQTLLKRIGWEVGDVDLWEVNEAFAVVPMAFMREMGLSRDIVNVNGGACALGHPIGASGARIIVTLMNALEARGLKRGVAAICIGGGEGTALALELV